MLTFADVCSGMLTYAERMLTYAARREAAVEEARLRRMLTRGRGAATELQQEEEQTAALQQEECMRPEATSV